MSELVEVSIPFVNSIVILGVEGQRLVSKYYDGKSPKEQAKREIVLFESIKVASSRAKEYTDMLMIKEEIVCFRSIGECHFFVTGGTKENELVLVEVLQVFCDSLSAFFGSEMTEQSLINNMNILLLIIDEMIDSGYILEFSTEAVKNRVLMRTTDRNEEPQTLGDVYSVVVRALKG